MKKTYLMPILVCTLLNGWVPNLVVDTKGRSGTFDYSRSEDFTNDKILCEELVKDNVNLAFDYSRYAFAKYVEIGTIGLIKADELKSMAKELRKMKKELRLQKASMEKTIQTEAESRLRKMGFREETSLQRPQILGVDGSTPIVKKEDNSVEELFIQKEVDENCENLLLN